MRSASGASGSPTAAPSAAASACANKACSNCTCTTDNHVTCSLCRQPRYCSEQCQLVDWAMHDCPNVIRVPSANCGALVPYYYEDMLTAQELATAPLNDPIFASYAVMYHNPNRTVSTRIVPSLVAGPAISDPTRANYLRGADPKALRAKNYTTYSMAIFTSTPRGRGEKEKNTMDYKGTVIGSLKSDMIYATSENALAKQLAKRLFGRGVGTDPDRVVFWQHDKLIDEGIMIPMRGRIEVRLTLSRVSEENSPKPIMSVTASYSLKDVKQNAAGDLFRKATSLLRRQTETKFAVKKGSPILPDNIVVLRYEDESGTNLILSVYVKPGSTDNEAQLVDIEFTTTQQELLALRDRTKDSAPSKKEEELFSTGGKDTIPPPPAYDNEQIQSKYQCDARSLDSVAGLSMALELALSKPKQPAPLAASAGVIQRYVSDMLDNNGRAPDVISPEVHTAIGFAINSLYEQVSAAAAQ